MARRVMSHESAKCTLTATGLVHEFYLRLARAASTTKQTPGGYLPFVSRMMRQILIDRARRRQARKTAETKYCEVLGLGASAWSQGSAAVEKTHQLESALDQLEQEMPDVAELVRMRLYLDIPMEVAASQLNLSRATAYRKWNFAKAWLAERLMWTRDAESE